MTDEERIITAVIRAIVPAIRDQLFEAQDAITDHLERIEALEKELKELRELIREIKEVKP